MLRHLFQIAGTVLFTIILSSNFAYSDNVADGSQGNHSEQERPDAEKNGSFALEVEISNSICRHRFRESIIKWAENIPLYQTTSDLYDNHYIKNTLTYRFDDKSEKHKNIQLILFIRPSKNTKHTLLEYRILDKATSADREIDSYFDERYEIKSLRQRLSDAANSCQSSTSTHQ